MNSWQRLTIWRFFFSLRETEKKLQKEIACRLFCFWVLPISLLSISKKPTKIEYNIYCHNYYSCTVKGRTAFVHRGVYSIYFASLFLLKPLFVWISKNSTWIAFIIIILVQILIFFFLIKMWFCWIRIKHWWQPWQKNVPLDILATFFLYSAFVLVSLFCFFQRYKMRSKTFRQPCMLNSTINF